jgi:hypothetical protein
VVQQAEHEELGADDHQRVAGQAPSDDPRADVGDPGGERGETDLDLRVPARRQGQAEDDEPDERLVA